MTEKQLNFIKRLAEERQLPTEGSNSWLDGDADKTAYVEKVVAGDRDPDAAAASRIIDWLLTLPVKQQDEAPRTSGGPKVNVEAGRYALLDEDGTVKFYVVDKPTEGKWAGFSFLNAQASDERHPIRHRATRDLILGRIAADPMGAMILYAQELGRCGCCGRTLTDELSRAAGIGPDCAEQRGYDRSVWAARAEQERANRLLSVDYDDGFTEDEAEQERAAYTHEMQTQGV